LSDVWQLVEAVNLRPEAFGGMAFHRERGITLEVDAEAYRFLCTCLKRLYRQCFIAVSGQYYNRYLRCMLIRPD